MRTARKPDVKKELAALGSEDRKYLGGMAYSVWDYIGYDCLKCQADTEEKDVDSVLMTRDAVIEVSLDAGRIEDMIRRDKRHPDQAKRVLAWLETASYEAKIEAVKPAFPHSRYGT